MEICRTIEETRQRTREARAKGWTIGFVPTMGYLHEGHASLMRKAREECDLVVASIFVNPLQFGPNEDFERYPRDPERDAALARKNGVDVLFMPSTEEMYPAPPLTKVTVSGITETLCGASRPGHFDGVATVVSKLFHIVQPDRAYFGMKDAQQVAVIEQMVRDLNMDVRIVPCPIVREPDGLAMSSRNVYLSPEERSQALVLYRSLQQWETWYEQTKGDLRAIKERIEQTIRTAPLADIDYVEIRTYPDLKPAYDLSREQLAGRRLLVALAVRFGSTRLIDNRLVSVG